MTGGRSKKGAGGGPPDKGRMGPGASCGGGAACSRAEKVETIRETYDSGRYVVESEKVAKKMIAAEIRRIRSRAR